MKWYLGVPFLVGLGLLSTCRVGASIEPDVAYAPVVERTQVVYLPNISTIVAEPVPEFIVEEYIVVPIYEPGTEPWMRDLLGRYWAPEVIEQALRVSWGESRWHSDSTGDGGQAVGLFQLHWNVWGPYCGVTRDELYNPEVNVQCAWSVYRYDIEKGQAPWTQWSVKPW